MNEFAQTQGVAKIVLESVQEILLKLAIAHLDSGSTPCAIAGDSKEAPWPKFVVCAKRCESKVPALAGSS